MIGPAVVSRYFELADAQDPRLREVFTAFAVVVDDGKSYEGIDEIVAWRKTVATQWTYTTTVTKSEPFGSDGHLVTAHLEGDFPGGEVDLQFRFDLAGGLISRLVIAP